MKITHDTDPSGARYAFVSIANDDGSSLDVQLGSIHVDDGSDAITFYATSNHSTGYVTIPRAGVAYLAGWLAMQAGIDARALAEGAVAAAADDVDRSGGRSDDVRDRTGAF